MRTDVIITGNANTGKLKYAINESNEQEIKSIYAWLPKILTATLNVLISHYFYYL